MKILEFNNYYPDEENCKKVFRQFREKEGIVCPKCGCTHHYWISKRGGMYQCAHCRYRQSLRANTVMHHSKLPFLVWFMAIHLLTATKHTFSAAELQRQVGWKYFQPVWEIMNKLRATMGERDSKYMLTGNVEIDEGFFTTEIPIGSKSERLKAGAGSQKKAKVVVMAEATPSILLHKGQKSKSVGHIKMIVVPDLKADTIAKVASNAIDSDAEVVSDATKSHSQFPKLFKSYEGKVIMIIRKNTPN